MATDLSKVSIPLLFPAHTLRYQRLFHLVRGSDPCQGLDIPPCPDSLLESPLAVCGSLALTVPILSSSSCLSRCQFLSSWCCHPLKSLRSSTSTLQISSVPSSHPFELPRQTILHQDLFNLLTYFILVLKGNVFFCVSFSCSFRPYEVLVKTSWGIEDTSC